MVDYSWSSGEFHRLDELVRSCRDAGLVTRLAAHKPSAHAWIRHNLSVDFQLCSCCNPTDRSYQAEHITTGNKPVLPAFRTMGRHRRRNDVACIWCFPW